MWQKQQQVGSHLVCAPFVNLVEWKIWKRGTGVCWTEITIIYNLRKVYQTKDIQPWSESMKSVEVWVIEKSYNCQGPVIGSCNCALAHCSCKKAAENFDRLVAEVVMVKIIFDKNSISVPLSLLWLLWFQFELDVWSWLLARVRNRKYLSVEFIFRISEAMHPDGSSWL